MNIQATTPTPTEIKAYTSMINAAHGSDVQVTLTNDNKLLLKGKDAQGDVVDKEIVITPKILNQIKIAGGGNPIIVEPADFSGVSQTTTASFREAASYLNSSMMEVTMELVMLLELDLSKSTRTSETELSLNMLNMMKENVNALLESKTSAANWSFEAKNITANAKILGGQLAIAGGAIAVTGGMTGALAGAKGLNNLSQALNSTHGLSEVGRGASSIIEGNAQKEAALKELAVELQRAGDGMLEFAKDVFQKGRQDADRSKEDFASNFQKCVDKYEKLTNALAQNFRLG